MDLLLLSFPDWDIERMADQVRRPDASWALEIGRNWEENMGWVEVDLVSPDGFHVSFAVWRPTGAVYGMDGPEVRDDPFLIPEGSPYMGPRELDPFPQPQTPQKAEPEWDGLEHAHDWRGASNDKVICRKCQAVRLV